MLAPAIVFVAVSVSVALALDCPYFQWNLGALPAMPCNLCLHARECMADDGNCTSSSYMFDCLSDFDGYGPITFQTYDSSNCNVDWISSIADISDQTTMNDVSGWVRLMSTCDHITFRSYPARRGQTGQNCVKDEGMGYYEIAVVEGCYNNLIRPTLSSYVFSMARIRA